MTSVWVAGAAALLCAVLLLRLCLGSRRQQRFDASVQRALGAFRRATRAFGRTMLRWWHWRSSRKQAARMAEEAIHRARLGVTRDGNVYKPKSFREPRKPH